MSAFSCSKVSGRKRRRYHGPGLGALPSTASFGAEPGRGLLLFGISGVRRKLSEPVLRWDLPDRESSPLRSTRHLRWKCRMAVDPGQSSVDEREIGGRVCACGGSFQCGLRRLGQYDRTAQDDKKSTPFGVLFVNAFASREFYQNGCMMKTLMPHVTVWLALRGPRVAW
jgi:hypothetical protein